MEKLITTLARSTSMKKFIAHLVRSLGAWNV
jgi:hypothetical protein